MYFVVLFDFLSRCSNYGSPYFYFEPKQALTLLDVPKWQLLGAMCGVPYIVIMVLAVQRIGCSCYCCCDFWATFDEYLN